MKFPKLSTGYNKSITKKQVSEDVRFLAIKTHIYSVLSIEELRSMKINRKTVLEVKQSTVLASC